MWKGPEEDGITQSLLNRFLECPYCFYLYTILGLEEEQEHHPNLIWGDAFHKGLELYIPGGSYKEAIPGMIDYLYDQYPEAPDTYEYSLRKMLYLYSHAPFEGDWTTEEIIDQTVQVRGRPIRIRGKKDAICRNHPTYGKVLGEHKAKGYIDPETTKEEIAQDLQCNLYMKMEGNCEWVFYDLIKIPDVQKYGPKPHVDEHPQDFINRIFTSSTIGSYNGQYPIGRNRHRWIHQGVHHIPLSTQEKVWAETIEPNIYRLCLWYDYVTQHNFDHTNPKFFNELFYKHPVRHFNGRKTDNFKCDYHAYLTDQIDLEDLVPVEGYYSELEEE